MKTLVYDLETIKGMFLCVIYNPQDDTWREFEVSRRKNQLDGMIKCMSDHEDYYYVSYNGLRFDSQIIEWIVRNYEKWVDVPVERIIGMIYQKAQDIIDDANYDVFPEYREDQLSFKQIDLFRVLHFDNRNRLVSLKRVAFEIDAENIEEIPVDHSREDLSDEELDMVISYCHTDVSVTYQLYKIVIGNTVHPLYKGNNQIQLRLDIQQEFNINCLNYSDSKIGDEMIKKFYCEQKRINYSDLPKKGTFRKFVDVKNCVAKYVKFTTPQLQKFLKEIKGEKLRMGVDFKKDILFYGNTYSFMQGGLHLENKPRIFSSTEDKLIIDWDVSSYYPAIIINNGRYPIHLGRQFLLGYERMFKRRLELKPLSKTDKRIKGIVDALKIAVNSVYGKSSDVTSWMYDRELTMFTTITGELSLMMLIEAYETNGISVISSNTDGITIFINKDKIDRMSEINTWWQELTHYELERTDYQKIIFSTVNDYLAIKTNGEVKPKGDYVIDFELYKNKSARIVPIAIKEYFVNNFPIEQTIKQHTNIYDFCIRQKSSKNFHYEGTILSTGKKTIYNKLIRYYVSIEGEKIHKIKNPECQTKAPEKAQVEAGDWSCFVCNKLEKDHPTTNIDFSYYVERANRIINKVEGHIIKKQIKSDVNQLSLEL